MTRGYAKRKFTALLTKYGAVDKYHEALTHYNVWHCTDLDEALDKCEEHYSGQETYVMLVSYPITWSNTSDGHSFWEEINSEWKEFCKEEVHSEDPIDTLFDTI